MASTRLVEYRAYNPFLRSFCPVQEVLIDVGIVGVHQAHFKSLWIDSGESENQMRDSIGVNRRGKDFVTSPVTVIPLIGE